MILASRLLSVGTWAAVVLQATAVPHGPSYYKNMRRQEDSCGAVSKYTENPSVEKWNQANTDAWLDQWWTVNADKRTSNPHGFAGAFGMYALGQPGWSCQNNGNDGDCDMPVCDNAKLNSLGNNTEQAYYVLQALNNLHGFFLGLDQSFDIPSVVTALTTDNIVGNFWFDENNWNPMILKQLLNLLSALVAIVAGAFAAPALALAVAGAVPGIAGAGSAVVTGGVNVAGNYLSAVDSTALTEANLGSFLGDAVTSISGSFVSINNELMYGHGYGNSGDIRDYLKGGAWVNFPGLQKNGAKDVMIAMMQSMMINSLWRMQRVFILGGGACGDGQGIGSGISAPDDNYICDENNKAWYLYFWQRESVPAALRRKKQGWLARPWGSDRMGQSPRLESEGGSGPFWKNIKPQDAIISSLKSFQAAGNNYTSSSFTDRMGELFTESTKIKSNGVNMEGLWTIPVCDISKTIGADWRYGKKHDILHPYGWDELPSWCGPICDNDPDKTIEFYQAANFKDDFSMPFKKDCGYTVKESDGGYSSSLWWDWTTNKTWYRNMPYNGGN
ncbi:uncharacterized protein N7500_006727 [Penicillium coprophilum]|uniref:uncharacterized protein n=1 Tax=Penicillium coprophilum TaxID=36646 RepID=UPI002389AE4D|nr:uncharacterized protein N7500_006727 [Penicillium coprophilum]KAJ5164897.1 hypothetical protein N7500_006727 [Penicillium coprophilum]